MYGGRTKRMTVTPDFSPWLGLGNKSTLVKVKNRSRFWLTVNTHVVSPVTMNLFCIKPGHDRSLTSTEYCECLNIILKSVRIL